MSRPTFLYFHSIPSPQWCEPCKKLTPMLEDEVKKANGIVRLLKLNVDVEKELAQALQLKSLPTVYLLQEGRAVSSFSGVPRPADLQKFMEQALARGRLACGDVQAPTPVHSCACDCIVVWLVCEWVFLTNIDS